LPPPHPPLHLVQGDDADKVDKIYVIGGAKVYEEALSSNYCHKIELTTIYSTGKDMTLITMAYYSFRLHLSIDPLPLLSNPTPPFLQLIHDASDIRF